MFSLFRKKTNTEIRPDQVWKSRDRLTANLPGIVANQMKTSCAVLVIAHFDNTLAALRTALDQAGLPVSPYDASRINTRTALDSGSQLLMLARGDQFRGTHAKVDHWDKEKVLNIVVVDRYPLEEPDQAIVHFAAGLPFRVMLTWHSSLADPFYTAFGSLQTMNMLMANIEDDETIEHGMVTKAINKTQKQNSKKVTREHPASSAEEWFRLNLDG